ncbi:hypothetical protein BH10CYA1_BH10CYA1_04970 [soil metagenome]
MTDYQQILSKYDDTVFWEYPQGFNYAAETRKFENFAKALSTQLKTPVKTESGTHIQDASFHSQIVLPDVDGVEISIRMSNFGNFVSIYQLDYAPVPGDQSALIEMFDRWGYTYIPIEVLEQPYTGINPGVTGIDTWWIRYFDWV